MTRSWVVDLPVCPLGSISHSAGTPFTGQGHLNAHKAVAVWILLAIRHSFYMHLHPRPKVDSLLTHSSARSLSRSLNCLLACPLTHSLTHSLTHPLTHAPTHPPTHPLTHLMVLSSVLCHNAKIAADKSAINKCHTEACIAS